MKYVVIRATKNDMSIEEMIIFSERLVHSTISELTMSSYYNEGYDKCEAISAGFCDVPVLPTYGKSETLKLKSREDDKNLPFKMQYGFNIEFN